MQELCPFNRGNHGRDRLAVAAAGKASLWISYEYLKKVYFFVLKLSTPKHTRIGFFLKLSSCDL